LKTPPALWRISRHCDLEGLGGERSNGRWHTAERGKRVVYLSEHPAVALVEVLANIRGDARLLPAQYQLMKVVVPEAVSAPAVDPLPDDWRENQKKTQAFGNKWLAERQSALLAVPSVPSPESQNYLFNPSHPDARHLTVEWCRWFPFDKRLFHIPA
jgi:RES domain-containing protein